MGEVAVPATARWGAQTQRAIENFPVSGRTVPPSLIHALAQIKAEAARENVRRGVLAQPLGDAIAEAADRVAGGEFDDQFPVDVFQTGSGTSTNMNMNEVVASVASAMLGKAVHPNDEVNASQSSNDVFPSAIALAATHALATRLRPALVSLAATFSSKARQFATIVKAGRTHLMDATPITLGQEFSGYASQAEAAIARLDDTAPRVACLALGGTAVGTGLNAPAGFGASLTARLAERSGLALTETPNHFAAQAAPEAFLELSGQVRTAAMGLHKIADDLRWMASGPTAGLGEIHLPDLQPGSSIMPGKVNPVIPEVVAQVAAQIVGNDATIAFALARGSFELNTYLPVIALNLLESIELLAAAVALLDARCVAGIEADEERCRAYAESSPAVATALNLLLGYDVVAGLLKESLASGRSVSVLAHDAGLATAEQLAGLADVLSLTRPTT